MSIDVSRWRPYRQQAGVCILASYGLAASGLTSIGPADIFGPYCAWQGISASAPTTVEEAAACAFANQEAREGHESGFALLIYLHKHGPAPFSDINSQCELEPYGAGNDLDSLASYLTAENAVAVICILWKHKGQPQAHSVAVAAYDASRFALNDPNRDSVKLISSLTEASICSQYSDGSIGEILILKRRFRSEGASHVAGSAFPHNGAKQSPGSAA
jgi:hypothetical protein